MRLAIAAASAVLALGAVRADAQRYYVRTPLSLPRPAAAAAAPAVPGTVSCSSATIGQTTYPEQDVQGPLRSATSAADGVAACNETGAKYGTVFKVYGYCKLAQQSPTLWYAYLVKATGVYTYDASYSGRTGFAVSSCVYNP